MFKFQNFLLLFFTLAVSSVYAGGYPHFLQNGIECESCHYVHGDEPKLLPPWTNHAPTDIDDTQFNSLCRSCHFEGGSATSVETHSSLQTDNGYGDWTVECRVCHDPHFQVQAYTYTNPSDYLYQGTVSSLTSLTITETPDPGWSVDEFVGTIVIPNISQIYTSYKIVSNTSDTLTVEVLIDSGLVTDGDTFGISYGKLINSPIILDEILNDLGESFKTGSKPVKFIRSTGLNSFADGDTVYDGICEVCHTQTTHFRNDGFGSDQLHTNVGGAAGTDCIGCHSHQNGFAHGGGVGTGCDECHGHDAGYGGVTGGAGTFESHSIHTESVDELIGPRPHTGLQ